MKLQTLSALMSALFIFSGCDFFAKKDVSDRIVMRVDERELSVEQFAAQVASRLKVFDALSAKSPSNVKFAKSSVLEDFLKDSLLLQWEKASQTSVDEKEVDAEVDQFRKQFPNDLAIRQALANQGISYEDFRQKIRFTLLQKKLFDSLRSQLATPTDDELKNYYNENKETFRQPAQIRLRQIVLEKEEEAERVMQELKAGAKLEDLARKFSIAPEKENGGDTGWLPKGTLEIFDKAFGQPKGRRSTVLKSPYGFHIYEVIDTKNEIVLSFELARPKILEIIKSDREQAAYSAWLEKQLKQVHVYRDDALINAVSVVTLGDK